MSRSVKIKYRDFYDVPRIFIVKHRDMQLLFDSRFDEDLDDYPDFYKVFVLPDISDGDLRGSWEHLAKRAVRFLGEVRTSAVRFDPSKRRTIESAVIDELVEGNSS